jgi:hypothetical protein
VAVEGPKSASYSGEDANHAGTLEEVVKGIPLPQDKRDCNNYYNDQETPEHVLNIRFSGQKRTGKGNFIETDEAEFGKDVPNQSEYNKVPRNLAERPE